MLFYHFVGMHRPAESLHLRDEAALLQDVVLEQFAIVEHSVLPTIRIKKLEQNAEEVLNFEVFLIICREARAFVLFLSL